MCANVCSQNKQASVHEHGCHAMCGHACLHTCTPCVWSSVRFTLHLLCFSQALPTTCLPDHRFTKHLLALTPCLPSTCWAVAKVYQAPALLFSQVYSAPDGFSQACQASAWLLPQVYQAPAWLFPSFTKHLRQKCQNLVFVKMTPFCWFAAACGGGAFLFYIN